MTRRAFHSWKYVGNLNSNFEIEIDYRMTSLRIFITLSCAYLILQLIMYSFGFEHTYIVLKKLGDVLWKNEHITAINRATNLHVLYIQTARTEAYYKNVFPIGFSIVIPKYYEETGLQKSIRKTDFFNRVSQLLMWSGFKIWRVVFTHSDTFWSNRYERFLCIVMTRLRKKHVTPNKQEKWNVSIQFPCLFKWTFFFSLLATHHFAFFYFCWFTPDSAGNCRLLKRFQR